MLYKLSFLFLVKVAVISFAFQLPLEFQGWVGCLSHYEARDILNFKDAAMKNPLERTLSIDLGYSLTDVYLSEKGLFAASDKQKLLASWDELEDIAERDNRCYSIYDDGTMPSHISTIGSKSNIPASLCPPLSGAGAPTMVLGGFTMHRIAGDNVDPVADTAAKLSSVAIGPHSNVLDTCMGLGYTAIGAGRQIARGLEYTGAVTTIEYDDASIEMCAYNPWSQQLFDGTLPISIRTVSDSFLFA